MNIPGLGLEAPAQPAVAAGGTRTIKLEPFWEWRFEVSFTAELRVKLVSGIAEKDGTELASQHAYTFTGTKTKLLTLQGCELEIDGIPDDEAVLEFAKPSDSPANAHLNLHYKLAAMRERAAASGAEGPRVMLCGPPNTGKTSLARTLASYAIRMGGQPLVVNADPEEGMLSLPGTLSASVFASILDVEAIDGWGTTPTSGPSQVPVKLPLAYYYGRRYPTSDSPQYRELVSRLAGAASTRFSQDVDVKSSGFIVDTSSLEDGDEAALDNLLHVADELSVNIVVVLGSARTSADLSTRLSGDTTSLGEPITVVSLDNYSDIPERDENFVQHQCEASIREYFFGSTGRTLSPATQQVDFDNLVIYRLGDFSAYGDSDQSFARTEPSPLMAHYTLAVMHASVKDSPEAIRTANVMGYVYVADVDKDRRKVRILAPVSGRIVDRPLLWGPWPEIFVNLLG